MKEAEMKVNAAQLLWAADCGILPVVEEGKLVRVAALPAAAAA
jgi:hypothetical protein